MLFIRLDQALELEKAAKNLKERLVIRYMVYNGLSPMEMSAARIEHLDPVECTLFLPRRHWKRNCVTDIDPETVRLQAVYSGARKKGPLIRSNKGGHLRRDGIFKVVKRVARRTSIPNAEKINPLILKRTFAREWLGGAALSRIKCPHCGQPIPEELLLSRGSIGTLQKQFSHKHLWSTAHYLRFLLEDVRRNHRRLMERVKREEGHERLRLVS